MKADVVASLREIRIMECVGAEILTVYSPAGSVLLPATKSKGTLTAIPSWAGATRVVAIAVSAIAAAITKALVFMGTSSFIFAGRVQADSSFARFAEFLSASSWSAL